MDRINVFMNNIDMQILANQLFVARPSKVFIILKELLYNMYLLYFIYLQFFAAP